MKPSVYSKCNDAHLYEIRVHCFHSCRNIFRSDCSKIRHRLLIGLTPAEKQTPAWHRTCMAAPREVSHTRLGIFHLARSRRGHTRSAFMGRATMTTFLLQRVSSVKFFFQILGFHGGEDLYSADWSIGSSKTLVDIYDKHGVETQNLT
jgi:hypothetical protein